MNLNYKKELEFKFLSVPGYEFGFEAEYELSSRPDNKF